MGKTFLSLFSAFKKEELCQLYVYPSFPNVDAVNSCYRITDRDAVKAIVPGLRTGGEVSAHEYTGNMIENKIDGMLYAKKSNDSAFKRIARDIVWKCSNWYSRELREWLNREAPDCIFLAPGYAGFIYDVALKIADARHIPIITYICDDYYVTDTANTWLVRYQQSFLRKKIYQTMKQSRLMIAISEEIKTKYIKEFAVDCTLIMTGANAGMFDCVTYQRPFKKFSYFGNIVLNRKESLVDIGKVLDEINLERGTDYQLNIYTRRAESSEFKGIKSIRICGFVTGEAFTKAFAEADCLVHVESFDKEMVDLVSGSISTKIADSLASGIPMLSYAPSGIASVEHLRRNNCAFIVDNYDCLKNTICQILDDDEKRRQISQNAIRTAEKYHASDKNSEYLKTLIKKIVGV